MLVSDLQTELALHAHDPSNGEISAAQWLAFIASAARDARSSGWLIRLEDDESITIAASTYEYNVPASFAYIYQMFVEETINGSAVYVHEVPRHHWDIRVNGSVPVFTFSTITELTPDKHLKIVGQQRPTIHSATGTTIDAGMESFLRERALYFGFRYIGAGLSELARWRQELSRQSWVMSEALLRRHPQEFRQLPNALEVPGRG